MDDAYYLVDVLRGYDETLEYVGTLLGLAQLIFSAAYHYFVAVGHKLADEFLEVECAGTSVDEGHVVDAERGLHLGHLVELVEHHVGVGVALELDDDAHALVVALVVDVGDAVELLVGHEVGYVADELGLVDVIGYLGYDDILVVVLGFDFGLGAYEHSAAACLIGFLDSVVAVDGAAGGEVGSHDYFCQFLYAQVGIVDQSHRCVDGVGQIVCGHVCGHAHGDARSTVHQQVGEACGKHHRLAPGVVVVRLEVDGIGIDVAEHFLAELRKAHLGVSHGRRSVAVDAAEVAVAVHQHVPHAPPLCHAGYGSVDG